MADIIDKRKNSTKIKEKFQNYFEERGLTKEQLKIINKLKKEKKYDDIYTLFGRKAYWYNVSNKHMRNDIKKLLKEGKFEDIYLKYGMGTYKRYLPKMEAIDIYLETGSKKKKFLSKLKNQVIKRYLAYTVAGAISIQACPIVFIPLAADTIIKSNARTYSEEIQEYNDKIEKYAKMVNSLDLNDLQTIMKVVDDMWADIDGYGKPEKDIIGFYRLEFSQSGGVGVCRNMADDVAAKLNAINPEYNARTLNVKTDNTKAYRVANIERRVYQQNYTVSVPNETSEDEEKTNSEANNSVSLVGNHMIVMMNIPGENVTFILDPTNPSMGIFDNGEIYTFSTEDGKGLTNPYFSQYINGFESEFKYRGAKMSSYFNNIDIEEYQNKYGIDAENVALVEAREIAKLATQNNNSYVSNNTYQKTSNLVVDMNEIVDEEEYGKVR